MRKYKNHYFTTFLFPLGTPLGQSRKTLHKWKDNSACQTPCSMYLSIFNSLLYDA